MGKEGFKTNLKALMLQKAAGEGEPITQEMVAQATGLSYPTIHRWYHSRVDRIEADTARALTKYFECSLGDLADI